MNIRSVATLGIGFGVLAVSTIGFISVVETQSQQQPVFAIAGKVEKGAARAEKRRHLAEEYAAKIAASKVPPEFTPEVEIKPVEAITAEPPQENNERLLATARSDVSALIARSTEAARIELAGSAGLAEPEPVILTARYNSGTSHIAEANAARIAQEQVAALIQRNRNTDALLLILAEVI